MRIYALISAIVVMVLFCSGCFLANSEALAAMSQLEAEVKAGFDAVATINTEIQKVRDAVKTGEMSPADAAVAISQLTEQATNAAAHVNVAYAKWKELRDAHQIPWWQIAIWTALGLGGTLLGGKYRAASLAVRGIVKAVHDTRSRGGGVEDVVTRVKALGDATINSAAARMPAVHRPPETPGGSDSA